MIGKLTSAKAASHFSQVLYDRIQDDSFHLKNDKRFPKLKGNESVLGVSCLTT